jgi:uncharacterized protein (TIGR02453 family)
MARSVNPFDEELHPPFAGFPRDAIRFFAQLRKNNTREWFEEQRGRFEESVREPMFALLGGLRDALRRHDPDIILEPKKAVFRLYRDVRFSKDKSPYKTQIAAAFGYAGKGKNDAGFYFHVSDREVGVGGGLYMPDAEQLRSLRRAIAADARPLRASVATKKFRELFGELQGETLQRTPQGFPPDHPSADLLRMKQFLCWMEFPPATACDEEFQDLLVRHFLAMAPFVRWLSEHS